MKSRELSGIKIANKIVKEKSEAYSLYGHKIWFGYNGLAGTVFAMLFFLSIYCSSPDKSNLGATKEVIQYLFWIACGFAFLGWAPISKKNFVKDMIKSSVNTDDKSLFSEEALQKVREEKEKRITATITTFKWCGVIISFLVLNAIGDSIRNFLGFDSINDLVKNFPIVMVIVASVLMLSSIVYYINRISTKSYRFTKEVVKALINNGLFVSNYVKLSAAEEIINNYKQDSDHK